MIYLDNAATTKPIQFYEYDTFWLNANTPYAQECKSELLFAEENVKKSLGVKSGRVLFGGCASEIADKIYEGLRVYNYEIEFCSKYEHDCIYKRSRDTFDDLDYLKRVVFDDQLAVVAHQFVNNVTGTIFEPHDWYDLSGIGEWIKESENRIFICDLTSAIGKVEIPNLEELGVDIAFWSGHKIHTQKNLGCAWFSDKAMRWLGDDFKLQEGTPNVFGAREMAVATHISIFDQKEDRIIYRSLAKYLDRKLHESNLGYIYHGDVDRTAAINAVYLEDINADALQQYLASKEIYVGLGASACAENHDYRVLNAFGFSNDEAEHIIRVSFDASNSIAEIDTLIDEIKKFKEMFV